MQNSAMCGFYVCDFVVNDGLTRESDEMGGVHQLVYWSILLVTSFTPSKQQETRTVLRLVWPIDGIVQKHIHKRLISTLKCSFNYPEHNIMNSHCQFIMYCSIPYMQTTYSVHAKFHNQPFIMCRAIWRHVTQTYTYTHSHTNKPPTAGVQLVGHTSIKRG